MTNIPKNLSGRVAVVAGGTRGAGRGVAVELGAAGATVYLTGRTTSVERSPMARDNRGDGSPRRRSRRDRHPGTRRPRRHRSGASPDRPHRRRRRSLGHPRQRRLGRRPSPSGTRRSGSTTSPTASRSATPSIPTSSTRCRRARCRTSEPYEIEDGRARDRTGTQVGGRMVRGVRDEAAGGSAVPGGAGVGGGSGNAFARRRCGPTPCRRRRGRRPTGPLRCTCGWSTPSPRQSRPLSHWPLRRRRRWPRDRAAPASTALAHPPGSGGGARDVEGAA